MKKIILFVITASALFLFGTQNGTAQAKRKLSKPASEWKKVLTPDQYEIMVESGTETPYKNAYWNITKKVSMSALQQARFYSHRKINLTAAPAGQVL